MKSSIKQTEDEGVEAHGQHGLVEGEEEGGDGVAETTEEEEEVGLGTRQSEPSHCSRYIRGREFGRKNLIKGKVSLGKYTCLSARKPDMRQPARPPAA